MWLLSDMSGFFTVKASKSTYAVIGVLAVVLVAIAGMDRQIKRSRAQATLFGAPPQALHAALVPSSSALAGGDTSLQWGTDPFANKFPIPVSGQEGEPRRQEESPGEPSFDLKLYGIVRGPRGDMALVNGELMSVGDAIHEIRLVHIGQDYVVLSQGSRSIRLTLGPQ